MVSNFPSKYIASSEGLRKALAKAKRFERIARQTDAPPEPSSSERDVELVSPSGGNPVPPDPISGNEQDSSPAKTGTEH